GATNCGRGRRELLTDRRYPGATNLEVCVVVGHPFDKPQTARVDLVFVVERPELDRVKALHVPRVEELVARGAEPCKIVLARRGRFALRVQHSRPFVLETSAVAADDVEKIIRVVRHDTPEI